MNRRIVMGSLFLILSGALVACGASSPDDEPSRDAAADARDARVARKYCYEFGGPSDVAPDAGDAGINPNVCGDGATCAQVTGESNWACFYFPPKN